MTMCAEKKLETGGGRQNMYKARTPWKEAYRQRCLERLRESRAKQHFRHRQFFTNEPDINTNNTAMDDGSAVAAEESDDRESLPHAGRTELDIDNIMREEWELMKRERESLGRESVDSSFQEGRHSMHPEDNMRPLDEDLVEEIRKEILADLRREELELFGMQQIYDEIVKEEEEDLCSALETLSTDEVICPVCEKASLIENKGVIACRCGLRIDTEQDCISLRNVQENLQAGADEHSECCDAKPTFSLSQKFGISNLLMCCEVCDFLFVIV